MDIFVNKARKGESAPPKPHHLLPATARSHRTTSRSHLTWLPAATRPGMANGWLREMPAFLVERLERLSSHRRTRSKGVRRRNCYLNLFYP
jgi:hypothetical protein